MESTRQTADSDRRATRVWNALAEMYGNSFLTAFGSKPNSAWNRAIADLTDAQCRAGLQAWLRTGARFAPSLPEFVAACAPETVLTLQEAKRFALANSMIIRAGESEESFKQRVLERMR